MNPYIASGLAHERQREAHRWAAGARLAALARCCKPSELSRLLRRLRVVPAPRQVCC